VRLDKFLWFVRLVKTRSLAQDLIAQGHLRIDGRPVDRSHVTVKPGMVLGFPLQDHVRVLRIEALPVRRGPAEEALACYTDLAPIASDGTQDASSS
jgi:ribosome-associated heat shock protein Hsp15